MSEILSDNVKRRKEREPLFNITDNVFFRSANVLMCTSCGKYFNGESGAKRHFIYSNCMSYERIKNKIEYHSKLPVT